jgi:16S rRNA (cytidine1402-2'-O)-methyltransferase
VSTHKLDLRNIKLGELYIVATPIGNWQDITLRAIDVLKNADAVICEDRKIGSTLAKNIGIEVKEWIEVSEHNETHAGDFIQERLLGGASLALITDCGTPVFSDPGARIIERALGLGARVIPIPGASSLMAALSVLDVQLTRFYFAGFLPRQPDERRSMLEYLRKMHIPVILMDTPYRMDTVLKDAIKAFGSGRKAVLACDLTLPGEIVHRGNLGEIYKHASGKKSEFILIIMQ